MSDLTDVDILLALLPGSVTTGTVSPRHILAMRMSGGSTMTCSCSYLRFLLPWVFECLVARPETFSPAGIFLISLCATRSFNFMPWMLSLIFDI